MFFKSSDFFRLISSELTLFFPFVFFLLEFLNLKIFGSFTLSELAERIFIQITELFFLLFVIVSLNAEIIDVFVKEKELLFFFEEFR